MCDLSKTRVKTKEVDMDMVGKRIRCILDSTGDLPKKMIGKYGAILSRNKSYDATGKKAYDVKMDSYGEQILWEDEFVLVRYRGRA